MVESSLLFCVLEQNILDNFADVSEYDVVFQKKLLSCCFLEGIQLL